MAQVASLNCPSCGAPLDLTGSQAAVKCPFCGNVAIVPEELRQSMPHKSAELFADVAELARLFRKIEAIKLYRQKTGAGLAEAKNYLDRL
jgi:LSD1 subclass zinc finger protein